MNLIMRPKCLQKILLLIKKGNLTDFWYNYDNNIKGSIWHSSKYYFLTGFNRNSVPLKFVIHICFDIFVSKYNKNLDM